MICLMFLSCLTHYDIANILSYQSGPILFLPYLVGYLLSLPCLTHYDIPNMLSYNPIWSHTFSPTSCGEFICSLFVQVVMGDENAAEAVVAVLEVFAKFLSEDTTTATNNSNGSGRGNCHVALRRLCFSLTPYSHLALIYSIVCIIKMPLIPFHSTSPSLSFS